MPNRIIKESICSSERISALTDFEFRLWIGLITQADDAGRGDARPAIIKGRIFPLRERVTAKDIDSALHGLAAKGCVSLYEIDGKPYFLFPTWGEHQRIRDVKPKYPAPNNFDHETQEKADFDNLPQSAANCGYNPIQSNPNTESESESKNILSARGETDRFERFWSAYPKKQGKEDARKRFCKINPSESLLHRMLFAIEEQKKSDQWRSDRGKYIPNPATWLNRGQWDDNPVTEIDACNTDTGVICNSFDTDEFFQAALKKSRDICSKVDS